MSFFSAQGISAGYGADDIIKDISFSVEAGQLTGILGANGSGKTTLLKAICGILPHSGSCTLKGEGLEELSPKKLARRCSRVICTIDRAEWKEMGAYGQVLEELSHINLLTK